MKGYIVIKRELSLWETAFETKKEAKKYLKKESKNKNKDYKIIKCKTPQEWGIFGFAMEAKGNRELANKGIDESIRLMSEDNY